MRNRQEGENASGVRPCQPWLGVWNVIPGMTVSWRWVLNTELTYDLFFQEEHCLNVVLEGGLDQTNVEAGRPVMRQLH